MIHRANTKNGIRYCFVCAMQTPHVFAKAPAGYTTFQCVKCAFL